MQGEFLHNMLQNQKAIVNSMAINEDGIMASGADNGSLWYVLFTLCFHTVLYCVLLKQSLFGKCLWLFRQSPVTAVHVATVIDSALLLRTS